MSDPDIIMSHHDLAMMDPGTSIPKSVIIFVDLDMVLSDLDTVLIGADMVL